MPVPDAVYAAYASLATVIANTIFAAGGALVCLLVCVILCEILHRLDAAIHGHPKDTDNTNWLGGDELTFFRWFILAIVAALYSFTLIYRAVDLNEPLFDAIMTVATLVMGIQIGLAVVLAALMGLLSFAIYLDLL